MDELDLSQSTIVKLYGYLSAVYAMHRNGEPLGVFATSDPEYWKAADHLIEDGIIVDTTEEHCPGGDDRCYLLTPKGIEKLRSMDDESGSLKTIIKE